MKPFIPVTAPVEADFFSVFTRDGVKMIHVHGYTYESDDYWADMECCGFLEPLNDFLRNLAENEDYVDDTYSACKQYQGDYTEEGIVDVVNHYYRDIVFSIPREDGEGRPDAWLGLDELTPDTPDGKYISMDHGN